MYESMYELAERVRFELTDCCQSTVFKTARPDRDRVTPPTPASVDSPRLIGRSMYESMYVA